MQIEVYETRINKEGRLVIPAKLRKQLGLKSDQPVLVQADSEGLHIYTVEDSIRRLQKWVQTNIEPNRNLVDELIATRRAETAKDFGG
jgi:AbrB family looped-hinge helix DNA binding protein